MLALVGINIVGFFSFGLTLFLCDIQEKLYQWIRQEEERSRVTVNDVVNYLQVVYSPNFLMILISLAREEGGFGLCILQHCIFIELSLLSLYYLT